MTPRTEAGREAVEKWATLGMADALPTVLAIEREAVEAYAARLREAVEGLRCLIDVEPCDKPIVDRAAVLELIEREKP